MILESQWENVRVINSLEVGSPISRNTAIYHSIGDICLLADDDIVYHPDFDAYILQSFQNNPKTDIISFEAVNELGNKQAKYPAKGAHNKSSLYSVFTWCMSFRRSTIRKSEVFFNHYFGVGSEFKGMTEIMFLRNAWDKGLKMMHIPIVIVEHSEDSSGRRMGSDNAFYAKSAGAQRFYGNLSYFWLLKYLLFTLRKKIVSPKEIRHKWTTGVNGIRKYKALKKSNLIDSVIYEH